MLSPTEGKEIHERVMTELENGRDMTPEDIAHLMQAAESGYAPAQNTYANVLNNVEGNLLAALPWYCKALQQGHADAWNTLRELDAAEALVREYLNKHLSVEQLLALRKRRAEGKGEESNQQHSLFALGIAVAAFCLAAFCLEGTLVRILVVMGGALLAMLAESYYRRNR